MRVEILDYPEVVLRGGVEIESYRMFRSTGAIAERGTPSHREGVSASNKVSVAPGRSAACAGCRNGLLRCECLHGHNGSVCQLRPCGATTVAGGGGTRFARVLRKSKR